VDRAGRPAPQRRRSRGERGPRPGGDLLVEVGLDLCLDPDGAAFVIEVNGKPRGRLLHLAQATPSLWQAHVEAAARPLRALAARCGG